jgi:hypothetical protein
LKLSRPTNEAKRLFVADYDWIAKNFHGVRCIRAPRT